MTSASARPPYILFVVMSISMATVACQPAGHPVAVVDLLRELDRAERRPAEGFDVAIHQAGGESRPSLVAPVPSRATWSLPLPRHGAFRAHVALEADDPATVVRLRVGVSDHRIYEGLADWTLTAERGGWIAIHADLSAYAGFQWSLFYRPDRIPWRVVLAADAIGGGPARALWGAPEIVTDQRSAREYAARRQALR